MTKTSKFHIREPKKHSVIYVCNDADAIATSIYVSKAILPTPFPTSITLTLTTEPTQ